MLITPTVVTVTEMVPVKFEANPFNRVIGPPNLGYVCQMVDQLSAVSSFPASKWGGNHGYFPLVLGQTKIYLMANDNNLTCVFITKPNHTSARITKNSNLKEMITFQDEKKLIWQEYEF